MVVTIRILVDALGRGSWDSRRDEAIALAVFAAMLFYEDKLWALDKVVHVDIAALLGKK